jgi:hypothetical protein
MGTCEMSRHPANRNEETVLKVRQKFYLNSFLFWKKIFLDKSQIAPSLCLKLYGMVYFVTVLVYCLLWICRKVPYLYILV